MTQTPTGLPADTRPAERESSSGAPLWAWGAGAGAAALAGAALYNRSRAKQAERDNPPLGRFITVDGVRLHYVERGAERGAGDPILLIHGNGTMVEDWLVSGLLDELATTNRVIAFDRPGFGHSERPRTRVWTPSAQAALIAEALRLLEVERVLAVGHSFGTLVTLALAIEHPAAVSGIVLVSGYYFPSARVDALIASPPAIPLIGDVIRYTASPLIGAALTDRASAKVFEPAPVTRAWREEFPLAMTLRPSQIRAEAAEAALMVPAAAQLARHYDELSLPVTIIAGAGDAIVDREAQSERLHQAIPHSRLVTVEGAGHMVHHSAPERVTAAIREAQA